MKKCNKCDSLKDEVEFGKRAASTDGLAACCRKCQKEYDSGRLKNPKRMEARREYQKTKGKDSHAKACRKWVANNTIKRASHILVGNALRTGALVKMCCEICGAENAVAHHDNYAKPLVVRWLCDDHHKEWHRINGEGLNAR